MLFTSLAALLPSSPIIMLTVARVDSERLRVTITPHRRPAKGKGKGKDADEDDVDDDDDGKEDGLPEAALEVLRRPLVITGTIDELNVDLPGHLAQYAETRTTMRDVFADQVKEFDRVKKETEEAIAAHKKRAAAGIPTIAVPAPIAKAQPKAAVSIL